MSYAARAATDHTSQLRTASGKLVFASACAGVLLVAVGVLVGMGWLVELPALIRLQAGWPSMKLNTAVCFAVYGAGVLALIDRRQTLALICAALVAGVGLVTEFEYASGLSLGIDELLKPAFQVEPGVPPGRMSPITAALFALAGLGMAALCGTPSGTHLRLTGIAASIIAGVALSALIGHATRTPTAYDWGAVVSMAVHTAASFMLVAIALGALAASHEKQFPRWLPWSALLAGMACTIALGAALFHELRDMPSLVPEIVLAVGTATSLLMGASLRARQRLADQRDLLSKALERSEDALVTRARLAAIVESSSEAIMSMDTAMQIVTFNPAAEALFGYPASGVRGQSVRILIPPDRIAEFDDVILPRLRHGEATRGLRTRRLSADGRIIEVEVDVAPLRGADGTPLGALTMTRDISERLAAEQLVNGVVEAAPDAVIVVDSAGRIMLVNRMAERTFGYAREQLIGMEIERLVPERLRQEHAQQRRSYSEMPSPRSMGGGRELVGLRSDGSAFPVEVSLNALQSAGRNLVVSTVRDITARRAAEQRLRDSLQEKELLLKEIHHRVKNNLQVIASMLTLQAMRADDTHATALLEACRQRVMSMAKIHEKLYGSRDMGSVDLSEIIREIATMVVAGSAGVELDFRQGSDPIVVEIETAFPAGLIANELITNSIKHAFAGRTQGRIRVDVSRVDSDLLRVQVQDDGVGGVSPQALDLSAGMGSTIIRTLVRQLDGTLSIGPGPGSSIAFTFPARRRSP